MAEGDDAIGAEIARIGPARLANAITAPSGILTFGAVTALGILGLGVSAPAIAGAAVIGAAAWVGGAVFRIGRASKRADNAAGRPAATGVRRRIDPFGVGEPWRRFVGSALRQQGRYQDIVKSTRPGPIRDRLASIGTRVDSFIEDVWEIAQRGDKLHGGLRQLDLPGMQRELAIAEHELATATPERRVRLNEVVGARRASIESAERLTGSTQGALDRLRELDAELDRLIVNAIEVSTTASTAADLDTLDQEFDAVVDELDGLRRALSETDAAERGVPSPPPAQQSARPAPQQRQMPG
jgi:hypothetical protein